MSEKEIYTAPETKSSDPDEVEIDWMGYLRKLIAARKALLWAVVVGAVLGVVVAFSIPKEYTVNVTLFPEIDGDSKSSGGLASLASSFLGGGAVGRRRRCLEYHPLGRHCCLYPICIGAV